MKPLEAVRFLALALAASKKEPPPGPVPKEALDYFQGKDLRPAFSYRDVWKEEHTVAFTVAKVLEKDLLSEVQDSLQQAIKDGIPFQQWAQDIRPTLEKSGWLAGSERSVPSRLGVIYNTNVRIARAVGQWQRIQRTQRALPYLLYQLGPSARHREAHLALEGLVLPVSDPFWGHAMPPNGWLCRCWVRQITRREADDLGGEGEAPTVEDAGIDEAFDYNPGASYRERLKKIEED